VLSVSISTLSLTIAIGIVKISQYVCGTSQLPVSFDAVPDRRGCPCVPMEVGVDNVSIQLGTPENMGIAFRIVTISQCMTEIALFPVSIDAIPDRKGCPCVPTEVGVDSVSIYLSTPENMG